ncbi:Mannose-6-phosphate isomerase, cupin superfamily [Nocardioides scoriae]|uniref:Mannose-6-phosphate isomerase, cupin superfamily n=1 Tax=Nocardioides scoriae TaxID=642780 RepID=A0A1H1WZN2_9ACTN|nr:phosphomannose isomerase type II C-terminal cupin domain [Nocardioides scoriae]SDT02563.1 Mannose-6-phosphate isomerase, cupin superfamily [Nocardioides scoriae]
MTSTTDTTTYAVPDAALLPSEVRPWGSWHVVDEREGYKVKRIEVEPGRRLSLQTHEHRSEHWVVVRGVATAVVGDTTRQVAAGGSVDVALGERHRLANQGQELLVIIEVQLGSYTGEDDICRLEDDFGR